MGGEAGWAPSGGLRSCACSRTGWGRHHHHDYNDYDYTNYDANYDDGNENSYANMHMTCDNNYDSDCYVKKHDFYVLFLQKAHSTEHPS